MKFNLFIVLIFIFSCTTNSVNIHNKSPYSSQGFAFIYNDFDYKNNIIKGKLDNTKLQISINTLKLGALIKLVNPDTNESIILKNSKKIKYPDFYKILITKKVSEKLRLDNNLPLVEILELKKNKSFIAKKAKIFNEEKKISSNAPITSVEISNISKKKSTSAKTKKNKIYILLASFYSIDSADLLKKRIKEQILDFDIKRLRVIKKNNKKINLISGPYNTINLMKNDYIKFKKFGFEELDFIIQN